MDKFRWEHGIQTHRLPLTDDLMRLIGINQDDENIQDTITKQATTLLFDRRAILHVGIAPSSGMNFDWEHDLEVRIARGGELLGDFFSRHWMHPVVIRRPNKLKNIIIRCDDCEEALELSKESLVKLED